ncbi:carboxypeptidase-like regulatory domain-containing protein [uncultured Kordia sp.]|uniref:carboxypeptidase-like regulatory domain-containing protein n=1 Tax=uncultured Kordia sp. TaxID=507699 RepID=UPI00263156BE|nr:carboxypeptidase-like regulatory domain-containing protein [uncultured Kordia sp.]
MRAIVFIISLLLSTSVFAQYTITLDAFVLDEKTNQPIPHVNIECVGKDIKAVTNELGQFTITFDDDYVTSNDSFQFQAVNYNSLTVDVSKLDKYLSKTNKIYLSSQKKNLYQNTIKGIVYNEEKQTVQNAVVRVKNTFTEVQTNVDGKFTIPAEIGDVLEVNFIGMNPKVVVVKDEKPINITLTSNGELLDAVLLEGKKEKKEKRYVDTGFGKVDLASFGLGSVLKSEDIGFHRLYITDVLSGRIAGLQVFSRQGNSGPRFGTVQSFSAAKGIKPTQTGETVLKIRGKEALVFYDGNPFYGDVNDINVNTVDNIVIVRSLSRTVLYGGRPAVLITSKNRFIERDANGNIVNSALATGNDYEELIPMISETTTNYIVELEMATTYEEALKIYEVQSRQAKNKNVPYYVDVSDYFKKWNAEKSVEIVTTIEEIAGNNPKALRTLAYKLEEVNQFEKAKHIYQKIATLLPNAAQSYRDLAMIYKKTENYQESLDLYVKMLTNSFENIDFSGLDKPLVTEIQQLLRKHRAKLNYEDIPTNMLTGTFKYDVRIVVEWNETDTEFEMQFVNPKNKFYNWEHSVAANKELMLNEVKNGYQMKEFIIDDVNTAGEWIINVKTLQNEKAFNPTYLKYTVYKNYGKANEESTVKVVKLYKQQQKVTLDKIKYQPTTIVHTR